MPISSISKVTPCGVAFIVTADGKKIYHSGDLNDWVWHGEGEEFNRNITAAYKKEIDKIELH